LSRKWRTIACIQGEVRQREEVRGLAWPSQLERKLYFCWRRRIRVRHCCCVLARCLGKEAIMLFPCYGIFSAIYECLWSSKLTLIIFLFLCSRNLVMLLSITQSSVMADQGHCCFPSQYRSDSTIWLYVVDKGRHYSHVHTMASTNASCQLKLRSYEK
jgi:hypothetical protein